MKNIKFMELAILNAKKGIGYTNPNPIVGAVLIKDNQIISTGYHHQYGDNHAEIDAINNANTDLTGTELYLTLEPCNHFGKTPPCIDVIIKNKIGKVIIGSFDPNPLNDNRGIEILRKNNIIVETNFLNEETDKLYKIYFYYIKTNKPFILMKYAMTIDGRITTNTGKSRWISNEASRLRVHETRKMFSSIIVGINTVLKDDPLLIANIDNANQPIRIILDKDLKIPLNSQIMKTAYLYKTIIVTNNVDEKKLKLIHDHQAEILFVNLKANLINLPEMILKLAKWKIDSILLEGGGRLNASFLEEKLVNAVEVYIAPKIFGGTGISPILGKGIDFLTDAIKLENIEVENINSDILIKGDIVNV